MKTGPVSPPAPSQVPAGVFPPRSVPNRVLQKQAPAGPDPGRPKQAPNRPFGLGGASPASVHGRLSGKPATIRWASIRQAGDFPADILPASRRLSVCGPLSTGRTRLGDRPFLSGRTLQVPSGLPSSKLSGRPFAVPLPEGSSSAGLRESGFGLGFPRRLALLPGCPTRASLVSFPKDLDPLCTGGVSEFLPVSGWSLLTAKCQHDSPVRVAPRRIWGPLPVDNVDNVDKWALASTSPGSART
jgi:hypothetical protein